LLIARQAFETRKRHAFEIAALQSRVAERQTIVRAVAILVTQGVDDGRAYDQLRSLAMSWQVSIEQAAQRVLAMAGQEVQDDRSSRA
jgi:AmiR/NasT family two-component response regulator